MHLLVVTNCSSRKTVAHAPSLCASALPRGTPFDLAEDWRGRHRGSDNRIAAWQLYAGRGFSLACEVAFSTGSQLRIVSAGLGLLHPKTAIAPYSLTLSPESRDCILNRAKRGTSFTAADWWFALRSGSPDTNSLERLLRTYSNGLLVLALTRPYLDMITDELMALSAKDRVRIVGIQRAHELPEELRSCVMPYDLRLNDKNAPVRGTAFDFSSRALFHFSELVKLDKRIKDAESHSKRVRQALAHWSAPLIPSRRRVSDTALWREIGKLKARNFSISTGLRYLRRERGIACEQSRFASAWERA